MRLLIAGDIHGDSPQVKYLINKANQHGADNIANVGDFGYWPHYYPEFLENTQRRLEKANKHLYWIDGNHENFDALYDIPVGEDGLRHISDNIHHIPRGHTWNWDGVRFMGFGGAPSIDKANRTYNHPGHPKNTWWPQEIPSREDEGRVFEGPQNSVDVLLAHDSPRFPNGLPQGYKNDAISEYNRKLIAAIVDHVQPQVLFHGHYHHRWNGAYKGMPIVGLDRDGSHDDSYQVMDTDNFMQNIYNKQNVERTGPYGERLV